MTVTQNNSNSSNIKVADYVDTVNLTIKQKQEKSMTLNRYILMYMIIFFALALFIAFIAVAYAAWASGNFQAVNQEAIRAAVQYDKTSPFVGITFMLIGIFGFIVAAIIHWLLKKTFNHSQYE